MKIEIQQIVQRRINDNATHCIQNGVVTPTTATRQVSFSSHRLSLRRVYKAHLSGRPSERSTWQLLCGGDIVIQSRRRTRHAEIELAALVFDQGRMCRLPAADAERAITALSDELRDWLMDIAWSEKAQAANSFLPVGCGWDGKETIQLRTKNRSLQRTFPLDVGKELQEKIIMEAMRSSHHGQSFAWDDAASMPNQLNVRLEHHNVPDMSEDAYCFWVLYHGGPKVPNIEKAGVELATFCTQSLVWASDYVGSKINGVKGRSIQIPKTVCWATKVILLPYSHVTRGSYGVAWNLFKR